MTRSPDRWRIGENVAYEAFADSAVALALRSGIYYKLNAVAARVLELLPGEPTLDVLVEKLHGEFEVEPSVLHADVNSLLTELERIGLARRILP